ncbi:MAG: hypothetical protein HN736_17175 [Anaerolineae bacterium]|mgnify:FL=1|jgi:tetratricopeptide (TPR) repeat protein|nr:hypothetical protein [Anaerolineae bacterium]MBT4309187.1 hypothetical protein [Anaerolineae bacterium]MBT4459626.1 hypothetical protein [Anaerolineae bacterium]MBT4841617.1 hypothetical protein [Anaerolineae bacterium]MBT6060200.1 hypothetical protein [Anaerolineae bacterium]
MWDLLALALCEIRIKNKATRALRDQVLTIQDNPDRAEELRAELISDKERNNCAKCDSRHFCNFFLACIYHELNDTVNMQIHIKAAIKDFYRIGSRWNEIFARWIYGKLLLQIEDFLSARREFELAIETLEERAKKYRKEDKYEQRDKCYSFINQIRSLF